MFRLIRQWRVSNALNGRGEVEECLREREASFYQQQRGVADRLASPIASEPPPGLHASIMDAVRADRPQPVHAVRLRVLVPVGIAAGLALAAAVAVFLQPGSVPADSPAAPRQVAASVPSEQPQSVVKQLDGTLMQAYDRELESLQKDLARVGGFVGNRFGPLTSLYGPEGS